MNIESEALIPLFETIILPIENTAEPIQKKISKNSTSILFMYFKRENRPEETEFLSKIISAIKLTSKDIENNIVEKIDDLSTLTQSKKGTFILWGLDIETLEKYKLETLNESTILCADSLHEVMSQQTLKSKLWACLKTIYKP